MEKKQKNIIVYTAGYEKRCLSGGGEKFQNKIIHYNLDSRAINNLLSRQ